MIKRTQKIIYVSGPYSNGGTENDKREYNIEMAKGWAIALINEGAAVLCPHTNTAYFDTDSRFKKTFHAFLDADLTMLNYVDAMFLLPNWKKSAGALVEFDYANEIDLPILMDFDKTVAFLRTKNKCYCCGLARTKYYRIEDKKYCHSCNTVVEAAIAQRIAADREKFIPIPRNP